MSQTGKQTSESAQPQRPHLLGRCKVCTKPIRAGEENVKVFHGAAEYIVCCASCAAKFQANPTLYLVP